MNKRSITIKSISILNANSINWDSSFSEILYLDTGNLTKNKISELQKIDLSNSLLPSRAKRKVKWNTILYSTVRPNQEHYGFLSNPSDNLIVSTGFTTIDIKDKNIDPKYIYYLLTQKQITDYLHNIGANSTSAYPSIRPEDIGNLRFSIPESVEKQKVITTFLSNLDDKIELNNKINTELEAMAKTLYDYWFVQFDFPDENGKPYKSSGGDMVWNEELKREIPKGWKVWTLLDIAKFTNWLACQKFRPKQDEEYYRVIKIREMWEWFSEASELVSRSIPNKVVVENGDVLFSWSATLDVMIWTGWVWWLNQHIFKVTSDEYPKFYYYFELLNYLQHFKMMAELRKTTMGHITQDHLKQSRIVIPPQDILKQLEEAMDWIFQKLINLKEENLELNNLRDWLLPMLMNGQVTVE